MGEFPLYYVDLFVNDVCVSVCALCVPNAVRVPVHEYVCDRNSGVVLSSE